GVAVDRNEQGPVAVGLLDVDGQAEADVLVADDAGLAVLALDEGGGHLGHGVGDGPDDRVADDVGEADLPTPGAFQVAVDDPAVDLEQLGRHVAEARGRRHAEAGLHVGHDAGGGAPERLAGLLATVRRGRGAGGGRGPGCSGGCRRRRGRGSRGGRRRCRGGGLAARCGGRRCRGGRRLAVGRRGRTGRVVALAAVVGEELLPALAHRARVLEVLLVHLVHEPGVGTESGGRRRLITHGGDRTGGTPRSYPGHQGFGPGPVTRYRPCA